VTNKRWEEERNMMERPKIRNGKKQDRKKKNKMIEHGSNRMGRY